MRSSFWIASNVAQRVPLRDGHECNDDGDHAGERDGHRSDRNAVLHIKRGIAHAANAARDGSYSSAPGALTPTLAGALL